MHSTPAARALRAAPIALFAIALLVGILQTLTPNVAAASATETVAEEAEPCCDCGGEVTLAALLEAWIEQARARAAVE